MHRLFKNLKNIFGIIIIIVILVSYFAVYQPLKNELENSLHDEFKTTVSSAELILEMHLNNAFEHAESLSSRTMIRKELVRYHAGEINFSELAEYTKAKYIEGASFQKNLLAAYRFVDDQLLVSYEDQYLPTLNDFDFSEPEQISLKITEDQKYIVVKSSIKDDQDNYLASDYVIYDLAAILNELSQLSPVNINYKILDGITTAASGLKNGKIVENRRLLSTDYYLKAETSSGLIYDEISAISSRIMLIILVTILVILMFVSKVLHDTSEKLVNSLKQELKEKTRLAEIDKMLGIYNRSKFNKELKKEIARANRYQNDLSLIMFDIDYFKEFNDNFGHHVGDEVLKKIVNIISEKVRKNDILARYGGDEFMIVCPETELEDARILAERLNSAIDNYSCENHKDLSCSFGVAEFNKGQDDIKSLIKRADQALYKAKDTGRNRVCKNSSN